MLTNLLLTGLAILFMVLWARTRHNNWLLVNDAVDLLEAEYEKYDALEQGRDEESEAYEMQMLSLLERTEYQAARIRTLEADRELLWELFHEHERQCLPSLLIEQEKADAINMVRLRLGHVPG